jgi:hypothetical protein
MELDNQFGQSGLDKSKKEKEKEKDEYEQHQQWVSKHSCGLNNLQKDQNFIGI